MTSPLVACICAFAFALAQTADAFSAGQAGTPLSHVTSYGKNFIVISSDPAAASWMAKEAENLRERLLREFQWEQKKWQGPLVLRLEYVHAAGAREKLLEAIVQKIFRQPPHWLRCGLGRFFSDKHDFHPDSLRPVRESGKWLDLKTLIERVQPFDDAVWQDIYAREAACLILFLKKKHPRVLAALRKGRQKPQEVLALSEEWTTWVQNSRLIIPLAGEGGRSPQDLSKALARCLRIKVRDTNLKEVLAAASIIRLDSLKSCCKKDLARRKLLACYAQLLILARLEDKKVTSAQEYLDCANRILEGKEFYDAFERLERERLGE